MMIKQVLGQYHVTKMDVSEISGISRVSIDKFIAYYEQGRPDLISSKGFRRFLDYLAHEPRLSKASILLVLLYYFGGSDDNGTGLVIEKRQIMKDDTLKGVIRGVEQQVQGGTVEPSDPSGKAQEVFEHCYGDYDLVLDFAGRPMLKSAYGDPTATYYFSDEEAGDWNLGEGEGDYLVGWDLHHMMPKGREGSDSEDNLIPVNINTNRIAGDKTSYSIDGTVYEVRRTRGHKKPYYAIYEKETGRFVIGFEPLNKDKKD
ncbi:MAG: hypothetical protein BWZ03_00004 [bacterium ADurb.BinA186]|nr:MAG: hypothetical protein BWZ03_00004 [bacterium ADurb.BinA186]